MGRDAQNSVTMRPTVDDTPELELALLRRGVDRRTADLERCGRCRRTPLIGERVYVYDRDSILCELCHALEAKPAPASRVIHGPEFGHTMRSAQWRAA